MDEHGAPNNAEDDYAAGWVHALGAALDILAALGVEVNDHPTVEGSTPVHQHRWTDVTTMSDSRRQWVCTEPGCGAQCEGGD